MVLYPRGYCTLLTVKVIYENLSNEVLDIIIFFGLYHNFGWLSWCNDGLQAGWLKNWGSIPGKGKRFSIFHSIQTGFGVHTASYLMGTRGPFSGDKAA
jgi:hypothetical protein